MHYNAHSKLSPDVEEVRSGSQEDPEKSQTAISGANKFIFDEPGLSTTGPRAQLNGRGLFAVFKVQEQNKRGELSSVTLHYGIAVGLDKNGKLVSKAVVLTEDQFLTLTGQKKKKEKPKCKSGVSGSGLYDGSQQRPVNDSGASMECSR